MINTTRQLLFRCFSATARPKITANSLVPATRSFSRFTPFLPALRKITPDTFSSVIQRFKGFSVQDNITLLQVKKRPVRKRRLEETAAGYFNVVGYATAEEYDLESLGRSLEKQQLYVAQKFFPGNEYDEEPKDVLHVKAKYQIDKEEREIYFFRSGSVILWNCNELECSNVLSYLKLFEIDRYEENFVQDELEQMMFTYGKNESGAHLKNNRFYLSKKDSPNTALEKYTYSNALSLTVKLGIWEATLDKYIDSMEFVTENLKRGRPIKISREEMLRKTGELFALRHLINLSSDLLDTPDFYWDREQLENLYSQTCGYFSIPKRTRVMNEKINHCVELADLISSHLNDNHHVRLEWMIIILIMVEVGFEIIHFIERFC